MASLIDSLLAFVSSILNALLSIVTAAFALIENLIKAPLELIRGALIAVTNLLSGTVGLVTGNIIIFGIVAAAIGYFVMNRTRAPGKVKRT